MPRPTVRSPCAGSSAAIYGPTLAFEPRKYGNLGYWMSADDHATWTVEAPRGGPYEVWFEWACDPAAAGNEFVLRCGAETLSGKVSATAGWGDYRRAKVGEITLSAGTQTVEMRSAGPIKAVPRRSKRDLAGAGQRVTGSSRLAQCAVALTRRASALVEQSPLEC